MVLCSASLLMLIIGTIGLAFFVGINSIIDGFLSIFGW